MGSRDVPEGPNRRWQAGLALLCVVGLFVAAVAAPAVSTPGPPSLDSPDGSDSGEPGSGSGPADDGPGGRIPGILDFLRWIIGAENATDGSGDGTSDGGTSDSCAISIHPRPTPGREVVVTVTYAGEPVADALIRIDGASVGRTDAGGQLTVRMPYNRSVTVHATVPGRACTTRTAADGATASLTTAGGGSPVGLSQPGVDGSNVTRTVTVEGAVQVRTRGRADPGTTIRILASIAGVPMRAAAVEVNGREVARTDDRGRARIAIPTDGTERLHIRVERGDFAGSTTVVVRLLQATISPAGVLAIPGQPGVITVTIGEDPARDAVVTRAGRRFGRTDRSGRVEVPLPADPTATFDVHWNERTASTWVAPLYAGTVGILALPLGLLLGAILLAMNRGASPAWLGARIAGFVQWVTWAVLGAALSLVAALDRLGQWLAALARRVRSLTGHLGRLLRGGLPALVRKLRATLMALPGNVRGHLHAVWRWLSRQCSRIFTRIRPGGSPEVGGTDDADTGWTKFDLRRAWRAVAKRVAPDRWQVRTPREIVRMAVERGLPREPLTQLASAFEAVEYGGRSLTAEQRQRTRHATERILTRAEEPPETVAEQMADRPRSRDQAGSPQSPDDERGGPAP